ncbi:hypothetical protein Y027_5544 [Burkholderia pseudomallei TSV5]|nr:hypothetical protein Y027_5544 [Burkholderia pseudomallei TSV5]
MTGDRVVERCADCTAMLFGGRGYRSFLRRPVVVAAGLDGSVPGLSR